MAEPYEVRRQVQAGELTVAEALEYLSSWLREDGSQSVTLRVEGSPLVDLLLPGQVVPHVRVGGERGTDRAKRYHSYKRRADADAQALVLEQGLRLPQDTDARWYLFTTFYRYYKRGDADNLHKAVADVLEGTVYPNDRQVRAGGYEVVPCAKGEDRTEVVAGIITSAE